MRCTETETASIFYVEADDERQAILNELMQPQHHSRARVIVLPAYLTEAFRSPKDFHDLRLLKRQRNLSIILVIPGKNVRRWATMNGLPVYTTLEEVVRPERPAILPPLHLVTKPPPSPHLVTKAPLFDDLFAFTSPVLPLDQPSCGAAYVEREPEQDDYTSSLPLPDDYTSLSLADESMPSLSLPMLPVRLSPQETGIVPRQEELESAQQHSAPLRPNSASLPSTHSPRHSHPWWRSHRLLRWLLPAIVGAVIITILVASLSTRGLLLSGLFAATPAPSSLSIGSVYFLSSGQLGNMGGTGLNDSLNISLSHLTPPEQGKSYYAWLRSDVNHSDGPVILLGRISPSANGNAHLSYVDQQHTNLLVTMSRFLITEEDSRTTPTIPSPDLSTWRYSGTIAQMPNSNDQNHYSLLDHLRHLLASDPTLEKLGLHGGLTFWLYRNTARLLEWAHDAQDAWGNAAQTSFMQQQLIRILDYLDGTGAISRDLPDTTPLLTDPTQSSIGILQLYAGESPPGYTQHIGLHLTGLVDSPGASTKQRQIVTSLHLALDEVQQWLENGRQDSKQLMALSNEQLQSQTALSLLNDLASQITNAYTGVVDPATGSQQNGVVWIYNTTQTLATIDVQVFTPH